jgi:uncharacterized coiled-coil DUF342 family protein
MGGLHIHIHGHPDDETKKFMREMLATQQTIIQKLNKMADKFDVLTQEVTELGNVVDSAVTLLGSIADQVEEAKDDPEQIQEIVNNIRSKKDSLAAAVAANTSTPAGGGTTDTGNQPA